MSTQKAHAGVRPVTLPSPRKFRFAVTGYVARSRPGWISKVRLGEELGYSAFYVIDHVATGDIAPMVALMSAAEVTSSLRIGTRVIDNDFRHPVLLAKEAATLDMLSEGRLELGLCAGWMPADYEQMGWIFERPAIRLGRLKKAVQILKKAFTEELVNFSGDHYKVSNWRSLPRPVQ